MSADQVADLFGGVFDVVGGTFDVVKSLGHIDPDECEVGRP